MFSGANERSRKRRWASAAVALLSPPVVSPELGLEGSGRSEPPSQSPRIVLHSFTVCPCNRLTPGPPRRSQSPLTPPASSYSQMNAFTWSGRRGVAGLTVNRIISSWLSNSGQGQGGNWRLLTEPGGADQRKCQLVHGKPTEPHKDRPFKEDPGD
jgi:hypothetical protein